MRLDGNSGLPLPRLQRILKRIITLHTPQDSTEFFCDRCSQKGSISPRFKKINKINESKKASAECASRRRHATRLVPDLQEICGNFTRLRAPPNTAAFAWFSVHSCHRKTRRFAAGLHRTTAVCRQLRLTDPFTVVEFSLRSFPHRPRPRQTAQLSMMESLTALRLTVTKRWPTTPRPYICQ